jgi:hypothetical protein
VIHTTAPVTVKVDAPKPKGFWATLRDLCWQTNILLVLGMAGALVLLATGCSVGFGHGHGGHH